ncbi:unnamed protein product [Caenorhabditis nigoni]
MKRARPCDVSKPAMMERRVCGTRTTLLRSVGVNVGAHEIPDFHCLALTETDYVEKQSQEVQATPEITSTGTMTEAQSDRYQKLDKKEQLYLRIGETVANMNLKACETTQISGKVKSSGEDLLRNLVKSMEYIQSSLGDDAKFTPFRSVLESSASLSGVHRSTISRQLVKKPETTRRKLLKEMGQKEKNRRLAGRLSVFEKFQITKKLHEMWKNDENVTLDVIHEWAKANIAFKFERTMFYHILQGMGFTHKKRSQNTILVERPDIVKRRIEYLRKKDHMDRGGVYFAAVDESWNHDGMTPDEAWQHSNATMYERSRMVNLDTPMSGPNKGKHRGKRGIVLAMLTEDGVLEGSEKVIISGTKEKDQKLDYHTEMSSDTYEKYIKEMVPLLKAAADLHGRKAAILCDNAAYHSKTLEKPPTGASVKADIVSFLQKHNVPHHISQTKVELVKIMQGYIKACGGRSMFTVYEIDDWASKQDVEILRLPPYHCFWNPIELLWSQLKQHLRSLGKVSDSLEIVRIRTLEFLKNFPPAEARKLMDHTRRDEQNVREMMIERAAEWHDESFKLSYDVDEAGNLVNVEILEDEEYCDDDFSDYEEGGLEMEDYEEVEEGVTNDSEDDSYDFED